jgi:porin
MLQKQREGKAVCTFHPRCSLEQREGMCDRNAVGTQTLWQKSEGSKEGVAVFLRGTMADEKTSFMSDTLQMGVVYTGVLSSEDKLGFAFVRSKFSPGQVTNIEGQDYRLSRESIAELTYLIPLKPYLRVQPDFQYISRPAGTSAYNNAWVLGVRATVDF